MNMSQVKQSIALACYHSSTLYNEFTKLGFDVVSFDLKPAQHTGYHIIGDVRKCSLDKFDFVFAFPPCTYLAKAQYSRYTREPWRYAERDKAVEFFLWFTCLPVKFIAIENPIGFMSAAHRQPNQIVRPWFFGDPYTKDVCLWTVNLPPLMSTVYNPIRKPIRNHVNGRMSQAVKSEIKSSWNYFPGMCQAIANQWGSFIKANA